MFLFYNTINLLYLTYCLSQIAPQLFLVLLAVSMNFVYVAAEFSLVRCRPSKFRANTGEKNLFTKLVSQAVSNLNKYISAAQVGITIASLVLGALAEPLFAKLFEPLFDLLSVSVSFKHTVSFIVSMLVATYFHVVIGEFIPKTLALTDPESIAKLTILPLELSLRVTGPLVFVLNHSANLILRIFGIRGEIESLAYTEEEIKTLLKTSQAHGIIEKDEEQMVNNVLDFDRKVVREIMTPRTEIIGVREDSVVEEAVLKAIKHRVSKLLVYKESLDNITGFISTLSLLEIVNSKKREEKITKLVKEIIKIPEDKPIIDLLSYFKKNGIQIALVLDEFGGTSGLVTLEDLIEELVGDIHDEEESQEETVFEKIDEKTYLIGAYVSISDVNNELGTNFTNKHFDTIGGYVFGLLGREAKVGDEIISKCSSFEEESPECKFLVEKKSNRKIERVKLIFLENISKQEIET